MRGRGILALGAVSALLPRVWVPSTVASLMAAATVVSVVYVGIMAHGLRHSCLAPFVTARLAPLFPRLTWLRAA